MKKFKKGMTVKITAGKDKGKSGEILRVVPKRDAVIIKGINLYKRHVKPTQSREGGIIERERPLNVAKIALIKTEKTPAEKSVKAVKKTTKKAVK